MRRDLLFGWSRPWQIAAVVGLLFFVLLYGRQLTINAAWEEAYQYSLRYDAAWSGSNGRSEFFKFLVNVEQFNRKPTAENRANLELTYDILLGRLETWRASAFRDYLETDRTLLETFANLRSRVIALEPLVLAISLPENRTAVVNELEALAPEISRISVAVYQKNTAENQRIQQEIALNRKAENTFVIGLLVLSTALLIAATWQNRSLARAGVKLARSASQMTFLARHDGLTGLPNRAGFERSLADGVPPGTAACGPAVFALDLDGFKGVNDTLGHAGGDALLVAVANRLSRLLHAFDSRSVLSRVGGDEFLVLAFGQDRAAHETLAREILGAFATPFETDFGNHMVGVSIGFAEVQAQDRDVQRTATNADLALNAAKNLGKGRVQAYNAMMRSDLEERLRIERDLLTARGTGQLVPHYQPQFDLQSGGVVGYEALARWERPDLGLLPPSRFISVAEASGDIVWLGEEILRAACRDIQTFCDQGRVSVNLSVAQIVNEQIVDRIAAILTETGLPSRRLTLEITESVVMTDTKLVLGTLSRLQSLGIGISLDDFGTGYSSLSQLGRFKWDELKIDRFFVENCEADDLMLVIVDLVYNISRKLGARLVVEGLETPRQRDIFRVHGYPIGQGYLYQRPVPAADILAGAFHRDGRSTRLTVLS